MWSDRDMEEHSVYDHRNTNGGSSVHVGVGGNGGVGTTRSGHSPHSVLCYFYHLIQSKPRKVTECVYVFGSEGRAGSIRGQCSASHAY